MEAIRGELVIARSETRAVLADVVADVERRLQRELDARDRTTSAAAAELGAIGSALGMRVAEFERVLDRVAQTCDLAVQTVQTNRVERLALLDAINELAACLPAAVGPAPGTDAGLKVVGGTVGAGPAESPPGDYVEPSSQHATSSREEEIAAHPAGGPRQVIRLDGVEVRCRFDGDHWVSGFEVSEVIRDDDGVRYRLRRRTDGYELPRLFAAEDVRDIDAGHLREVPGP